MKKFHLTMKFLLTPLAAILFPCKIMDKDNFKKYDRGQVLIGNHLSWMDVSYHLFWVPGFKRPLSKKENLGGPFRNWFMRNVGIMFVDREKPELSTMRECLNCLKDGYQLDIFPEGKRNRENRELMPLHSGAALFALKSKCSVIPVVVHHKAKICKRNYIGFGDRIELNDLFEKRIDEAALNEATERFRAGMQRTLDKLDIWVETKGWKREKKMLRAEKRAFKQKYKQAKKSAKKALKDA